MRQRTLVAALATALAVAPARAQVASVTEGLMVNLHLNGSFIEFEDEDAIEKGGGLGLTLGWGFSRRFMLYAVLDGATMDAAEVAGEDDYSLGHVDLGGRYSFADRSRRWVPYLEAGLTARAAEATVVTETERTELDLTGGGLSLGGGVQYFFSAPWALDVSLRFTGGEFTDARVDDREVEIEGIQGTTTRFHIGVSWYPLKRYRTDAQG